MRYSCRLVVAAVLSALLLAPLCTAVSYFVVQQQCGILSCRMPSSNTSLIYKMCSDHDGYPAFVLSADELSTAIDLLNKTGYNVAYIGAYYNAASTYWFWTGYNFTLNYDAPFYQNFDDTGGILVDPYVGWAENQPVSTKGNFVQVQVSTKGLINVGGRDLVSYQAICEYNNQSRQPPHYATTTAAPVQTTTAPSSSSAGTPAVSSTTAPQTTTKTPQSTTSSPQTTTKTPQSTTSTPQTTTKTPQSTTSSPQDTSTKTPDADSSTIPKEGNGFPVWVIGLIVVAALAVILGVLLFFYCRRRPAAVEDADSDAGSVAGTSERKNWHQDGIEDNRSFGSRHSRESESV